MPRIVTFFSWSFLQCDINVINNLNNVIRTHLVKLNGSLTTQYLQKFIGTLKISSFRKKCPSVFLYHTERYRQQTTGTKIQTKEKISHGGRNDRTARVTEWFPHYHLTYKSLQVLFLKLVSFERSVLVFACITQDTQYYQMPLCKDVITRILVTKFRPKARCQMVGLMK